MMAFERITASRGVALSFAAKNLFVTNPTGRWVYVRVGGQDAPSANGADLVIAPFTYFSINVPGVQYFGFTLGAIAMPTQSDQGAQIVCVFSSDEQAQQVTNINLPGVAFAPGWQYSTPAVTTAPTVLINPGAESIVLFQVRYESDPTKGAQYCYLWHTTEPDLAVLQISNPTNGGAVVDIVNFLPHGLKLAAGAQLQISTDALFGTLRPGIGILYQLAG